MEGQEGECGWRPVPCQHVVGCHPAARALDGTNWRLLCALQLIKAMESARGNGTSMISLILPPRSQVMTGAGAQLGVNCALGGLLGCSMRAAAGARCSKTHGWPGPCPPADCPDAGHVGQ